MKIIAKKTNKKTLLTLELIFGAVTTAAVAVFVPAYIFSIDESLIANWFVWCIVLGIVGFYGLVSVVCFIYPFFLFRKLPEVQAETDGTYLYIYGKKEAKIPLADMDGAYFDAHLPYIMSKEFIISLLSEEYGDVIIQVPGHGKFKLHFISHAQDVPGMLAAIADNKLNGVEA